MTRRPYAWPRALPALLLLTLLSGCARPHYGLDSCPLPGGGPAELETASSLRYRVRSDAGRAAAQEVDRFMERAASLWIPLFGVPAPASLPLEVRLHRDPRELAAVLASRRLPTTATGLYLPSPPPAIHVACRGDEPGHPYRTLLHEGTHQFVHLGAGYRAPGQPAAAVPRIAIPLWLNEGLASYFEAAYLTPDLFQPGRPEKARLEDLRTALHKGKVPELQKILSRSYGETFTALDYAIAWGMVYALMQEAPPAWASGGRDWLKGVIDEGRRGWPSSPPADGQQWWLTVTEQTRLAFVTFATQRCGSLAAWEEEWRRWITEHP